MASPAEHHSPESGVKEMEGDLVLEFGRRLKANFEREAGGKESDAEEEKCSDGPQEPSEQTAELQSLESCGQTGGVAFSFSGSSLALGRPVNAKTPARTKPLLARRTCHGACTCIAALVSQRPISRAEEALNVYVEVALGLGQSQR